MKSFLCGFLITLAALIAFDCGGKITPKARIDQADRGAFEAMRAFQLAERAAYTAKAPWPSAATHAKIKEKLSSGYSLVIDVANIGVNLKPGQSIPQAALTEIDQLTQTANDIVALVDPTAAPDVKAKLDAMKATVSALIAIVKGIATP